MNDLQQYRARESEVARTNDLLRLVPKGRHSVLDIGARDGHFSRLLTDFFTDVTALDLGRPDFRIPHVQTAAGDVTQLGFSDESFDCVFCAEVLEHVVELQKACSEITRVAKHEVVLGVPFKQDTRCGRTTCVSCGKHNPAWGHVNRFDERRLLELFPNMRVLCTSFVGKSSDRTNFISRFLMDLGGNPWGTYDQEEPCVWCGANLMRPGIRRNPGRRILSAIAERINRIQAVSVRPHANWIHVVFAK